MSEELVKDCYLYILNHMTRTMRELEVSEIDVSHGLGYLSGVKWSEWIPKYGISSKVANKEGVVHAGAKLWFRKRDPVRAAKIFIENEKRIIKEHEEAIKRANSTIDALNEIIKKEELKKGGTR